MNTNPNIRRYDLDWLRILAILTVFVYHSSRFFNLGDWHVKNMNTFTWVEIWNIFATRWMMPLFFIISGASLFYAMGKSEGWWRFYSAKFKRLMVPVLVACITHSVLQVYLERLSHGQFSGSFFSFFPEGFTGVYLGIGMSGNFAFHGMHLWYLLFLFVYSLICYRLFIWFKGNGNTFLNRIASFLAIPGWIYLGFTLPLLAMKAILPSAVFNVGNGGWGFITYFWFLISGFIIFSSNRLLQLLLSQRRVSLFLGIILSTAHLYQSFGLSPLVLSDGISNWVSALLSFLSAWCWLFAILGFAIKYLAFEHPFLKPANEGVMPFYILHQTVLLLVGYYIMSWDIHDVLKWVIVFVTSFIIIIALVTLMIQRIELLRFLFGMKTTRAFFDHFRKKSALVTLHAIYVALIVFAVVQGVSSRSAMPMRYDPDTDVILNAQSITHRSLTGVEVVKDETASIGQVIEFVKGANQHAESNPTVFIEMRFTAATGRYFVWLRGKTDQNDGYTDSVWVQIDDQIGSTAKSIRMGNWLDVHPPGVYGWAGDTDDPISVVLKHTGDHTIRIQPRQVPHRIDQVWLSRLQERIPDTNNYIEIKETKP